MTDKHLTPEDVYLRNDWFVENPAPALLLDPPCSKVYLVGQTMHPHLVQSPDPIIDTAEIISQVAQTFEGIKNPGAVAEWDVERIISELQKTGVAAPLQFVHFVFLIDNVTRNFTHQLVRYRVGTAYTQQSLRFHGSDQIAVRRSDPGKEFEHSVSRSINTYWEMRNSGVHPQFARGVLPMDTLNYIWFSCSFATLQHIYKQRMTVQAQPGEWQEVLSQMHDLLPENLQPFLRSCCTSGGECPFASMWDRPCMRHSLEEKLAAR